MRLPADNSIELPAGNDRLTLDTSDRPVPTLDDAIALLPEWAQEMTSDVRDAVLGAIRDVAQLVWARTGQVFAQLQSPRFAAGAWLAEWGALRKLPRQPDETEGQHRARCVCVWT